MVATGFICLMHFIFGTFFCFGVGTVTAGNVTQFFIRELMLRRMKVGIVTISITIGKINAFLMCHQGKFFCGFRLFAFFD